jgi:hypothetical protein
MDLEFPRFVFTSPGPLPCNGGTYGEKIVQDEDEHEAALKAGFFSTLPEALEDALTAPKAKAELAKAPATAPKAKAAE